MKLLLILFLILFPFAVSDNPITADCKCRDIPLFGKVEIKKFAADFKILIVPAGADIRIDTSVKMPDRCGQWEFVKACGDFSVEFVPGGEDFTVEFVKGDPGID